MQTQLFQVSEEQLQVKSDLFTLMVDVVDGKACIKLTNATPKKTQGLNTFRDLVKEGQGTLTKVAHRMWEWSYETTAVMSLGEEIEETPTKVRVIEMYEKGISGTKIAKAVGCSTTYVYRTIKQLN